MPAAAAAEPRPPPWHESVPLDHAPNRTLGVTRQAMPIDDIADGAPPYVPGGELGRGGLGVVSRATQTAFAREVAIKRLISTRNPESELLFRAEAIVTAGLEHPNIVPIHDLIAGADGRQQLVMKLVQGVAWRDLLDPPTPALVERAAKLGVAEHLEILLKVCDAVAFAHQRGILHRDLKPENVMVGDFGEVQVMDWGCAVAFGEDRHHPLVQRVEAITGISGTPAYMSPEMAMARVWEMGPHSDVYLLGGMLYEILTGGPPHRGKDVHAVLERAALGDVQHPAERAPDRQVAGELASTAMAALARSTATRIPTVEAFAQRLRDYRTHAQAMTLARIAKTHLDAAKGARSQVDERLRKAIAAAEYALELWPNWPNGLKLQAHAVTAYAEHCLATGAFAIATTQATLALKLARQVPVEGVAETAGSVLQQARKSAAAEASHQRQLAATRRVLTAAGAAVALGLVVAIALVAVAQRRASSALAAAVNARNEAQGTLASLEEEQAQRRRDQRSFAPSLLAQARAGLERQGADETLRLVELALSFDPALTGGHSLRANLLAAKNDHRAALLAIDAWRAADERNPFAPTLKALCERSIAGEDKTLLDTAFGDLFVQQELFPLAEGRFPSNAERLALYQARIDKAWRGAARNISMSPVGTLLDSLSNPVAGSGFVRRSDVADLSPLRGMPFETLNLQGTPVVDLAPLGGMPLREISLVDTRVKSLAPLAKAPLSTLLADRTRITDLTPIGSQTLRFLSLQATPIGDLEALRQCTSLAHLDISGTAIKDLAPLAGRRLDALIAADCRDLASIAVLRGMPLRRLVIGGTRVSDLAPLAGMPLEELDISGSPAIQLAALAQLPLRVLHVVSPELTDLEPLADLPLEQLALHANTIRRATGLGKLRQMRTLKAIGPRTDRGVMLAKEFWQRYDAGEWR